MIIRVCNRCGAKDNDTDQVPGTWFKMSIVQQYCKSFDPIDEYYLCTQCGYELEAFIKYNVKLKEDSSKLV